MITAKSKSYMLILLYIELRKVMITLAVTDWVIMTIKNALTDESKIMFCLGSLLDIREK